MSDLRQNVSYSYLRVYTCTALIFAGPAEESQDIMIKCKIIAKLMSFKLKHSYNSWHILLKIGRVLLKLRIFICLNNDSSFCTSHKITHIKLKTLLPLQLIYKAFHINNHVLVSHKNLHLSNEYVKYNSLGQLVNLTFTTRAYPKPNFII